MDSVNSEAELASALPQSVKIMVAGGFGVGKTTLVGAVSEIAPVSTEEVLTERSVGVDDLGELENKKTTTVALDWGRITLDPSLVLYLFGTPGQERFGFLWEDLAYGALGAVVLVDTRRLETGFAAVDFFFEVRRLPFVVAVNEFDGSHRYTESEIRQALRLPDEVPIRLMDARDRQLSKQVLLDLIDHLIAIAQN